MRLIFLVFLLVFMFIAGSMTKLATEPPLKSKSHPEYEGVDPALQPLVDEYKSLAEKQNIKFTHEVSVGFTDINHKEIVGLCHYGEDFREIDIDQEYFNKITDLQKRELVFHELTHCYCLRKHDFDQDKPYPEANDSKFDRVQKYHGVFWISPGFFIDGCPTSIMYPYVLDRACYGRHQEHYEKEMFERCTPY